MKVIAPIKESDPTSSKDVPGEKNGAKHKKKKRKKTKHSCSSSSDDTPPSGEKKPTKTVKRKKKRSVSRRASTGGATMTSFQDTPVACSASVLGEVVTTQEPPQSSHRHVARRGSTGMILSTLTGEVDKDPVGNEDNDNDDEDIVMPLKDRFARPDPRLEWMRSPSGRSKHLELLF